MLIDIGLKTRSKSLDLLTVLANIIPSQIDPILSKRQDMLMTDQ